MREKSVGRRQKRQENKFGKETKMLRRNCNNCLLPSNVEMSTRELIKGVMGIF